MIQQIYNLTNAPSNNSPIIVSSDISFEQHLSEMKDIGVLSPLLPPEQKNGNN
jgi:hypothetical protein